MKFRSCIAFVLITVLLSSCAIFQRGPKPEFTTSALPPEKQDELAMKVYTRVLDKTTPMRRVESMPIIVEGYKEVMNDYPGSFQAEESYYRLMNIALRDQYPPDEAEAVRLYNEYFRRYKEPRLAMAMNSDLAMYYYTYKHWKKLELFTVPFMREFVMKQKYGNTMFLFLYAEATYHQGNFIEARKGYRLMKKMRPGSSDAKISIKRLEDIEKYMIIHGRGKKTR